MGFTIYLGISVVIMVEATGTRLFLVVAVFGVAFGAASLLEHLLRDSVPPDLLANGPGRPRQCFRDGFRS
jgi:hypothetical protein